MSDQADNSDVSAHDADGIDSELPPELSEAAAEALARLADLDRVLPRSIEDWVAERERDGQHVPAVLKQRLVEKERLRAIYRRG